MQDDNAMNGTLAEISKLKADLAKAEKDRNFWHEEANQMRILLGNAQANRPSPGAKLYGQACAREQVARDLLDRAKRAWQLAEMMSPDEIRDFARALLKEAKSERENGKEIDRIASESAE